MYNVYAIMYNVYVIMYNVYVISVRATSLSVMQLFSYPRKINNKALLKHDLLAEVNVIIV